MYSVPVNNGLAPTQPQGARATKPVTFNCPFQANNQPMSGFQNVDMIMEDSEGVIDNVQTIFFDTAQCNSNVYLVFQNSGQRLVLPAKSQGYLPVACGNEVRFQYGCYEPGGSGYAFTLQFFNVPMEAVVWDVLEKLRMFPRTQALTAAGGTGNFASGVNLTGLINPGQDFSTQGTQVSSLGQAQSASINSQAFGVQTLGIDILISGSASVSTQLIFTWPTVVTGWGPNVSMSFAVNTDANGNAFAAIRYPSPGFIANGMNYPNLTWPAVITPTLYQATMYFKIQ